MRIVFRGANAETFLPGFSGMLGGAHEIRLLSDALDGPGEAAAYGAADIVIGIRHGAGDPPLSARLFQLPSAGHDGIDMAALPPGCSLCNVFGHEGAIAEYVFAALLARHVPLRDADAKLRRGDWEYWAGKPTGLRTELGAQTIGIVGHGHIGKALADRARAFGMRVHVANRSGAEGADAAFGLAHIPAMAAGVDVLVNTLPLAPNTEGLIGAEALAALPDGATVMNVGRGPVIDEAALFAALKGGRISGILDTWYVYPSAAAPGPAPSRLPFDALPNVVLTPHMSGWTHGTIARRQRAMATNVDALDRGAPLINIIHEGVAA